jgi:hypothetical protein
MRDLPGQRLQACMLHEFSLRIVLRPQPVLVE